MNKLILKWLLKRAGTTIDDLVKEKLNSVEERYKVLLQAREDTVEQEISRLRKYADSIHTAAGNALERAAYFKEEHIRVFIRSEIGGRVYSSDFVDEVVALINKKQLKV